MGLLRTILTALGIAAGVVLPAAADPRPVLTVPRMSRPPTLDHFRTMTPDPGVAAAMTRIDGGFVQRRPVEGDPASRHTDVYLGYDDQNLYVVFVAFDDDPERIRANLSRRESVFGDDIVEIQLDTFQDQRRAYTFVCNPLGVQWDAIWTEGSEFDMTFDTVWSSRGTLTDRGYVVWMAIPFRSLRFPEAPEQAWGFLLGRDTPHENEETFFPGLTTRVEGRLNQAGTLRGLRDISPGRNVQLIPYASGRAFRVLDDSDPSASRFVEDDADLDAGVDAKWVLRDRLVLDVTLNPDFSQVESDEPQVTVNERFEVFFPEKRPFFLENASFLQTPPPRNLVFTRRIGEPRIGARLTGKLGHTNLGLLLIDDEAPGKRLAPGDPAFGDTARFGVARLTRDVGEQSSVGGIVTTRDFGGGSNRVAGLDGRIKLGRNWVATGLAAVSRTELPGAASTDDMLLDVRFDRSGRHLSTHIHHASAGPDFRAEVGFVPRTDMRDSHTRVGWTFRPEGPVLLTWTPSVFVRQVEDHAGRPLDGTRRAGLNLQFRRQTELRVSHVDETIRLRDGDAPNVAGMLRFGTRATEVGLETRPLNAIDLSAEFRTGRAINFRPAGLAPPSVGDSSRLRVGLTLRPLPRLAIRNTALRTTLDAPASGARVFTDVIVRSRWDWQFDRRASLRLIAQYESLRTDPTWTLLDTTKNRNLDALFTYLVNPWTALYVGYNGNRTNLHLTNGVLLPTRDVEFTDARQVFVKLSYLFRY